MNLDIPGYRLGATIGHEGDVETCRGQRTRDRLPVSVVAQRPGPALPGMPGRDDDDSGARALLDLTVLNDVDGVVPVIECGVTRSGHCFAVFERPPEGSLAERLLRGRLRAREAIAVGLAIGQALAGAHAAGFRHGRLGPASIVFGPGGRIRLTGFSPVRRPGAEMDDVAALGRLLLVATDPPRSGAHGPPPGGAVAGPAGAGGMLADPAPPPATSAELPADLRATLTRAAGAGRLPGAPSTAAELVADLETVAETHGWPVLRPVYAMAVDARRRARARRRRRRRLLVPTVLLLVAAGGAVAVLLTLRRQDGPPTVALRTAQAALQPGVTALPPQAEPVSTDQPQDDGPELNRSELDRSGPPPLWVVGSDGAVIDSVGQLWSEASSSPTVDVALRADGLGGWQLLADGRVRPFGDAADLGSGRVQVTDDQRPVALVPDAAETGAWVVFGDGESVALGTAVPFSAPPAPAAPIVAAARSVGGAGYLTLDSQGNIDGTGDAVVRRDARDLLDTPAVALLVFNEAHVVVATDGSYAVIAGEGAQATHDVGRLAVEDVADADHAAGRIVVTGADGVVSAFPTDAVVAA